MRLCTICARGGSKGVPGKNIRPLQGKPLIAHTIAQARASGLFSAIAVSSDSPEILAAATDAGVDLCIVRPAEMANDTAAKIPAIAHALTQTELHSGARFDVLVDLDATSPLRTPEDIIAAVALLETTGVTNVITGAVAHRSPYFNLVETDPQGVVHLSKTLPEAVVRRQDSPPCYDMNGSIYVWQRDAFLADPRLFYPDTRIYVMPPERSLDIDSELDWAMVEWLMARPPANG